VSLAARSIEVEEEPPMRSARTSALGLAFASALLGGCASAPAQKGPKDRRVCVDRREINAITALDDEHVFLKVSAGRFYLVTVRKMCGGLRLARTIAIDSPGTRVCGDSNSLLSFEYPAVGPTRCPIEQIESVADKAAALELIESRAGPQ
jgi:hypothetical protein